MRGGTMFGDVFAVKPVGPNCPIGIRAINLGWTFIVGDHGLHRAERERDSPDAPLSGSNSYGNQGISRRSDGVIGRRLVPLLTDAGYAVFLWNNRDAQSRAGITFSARAKN
jgi:hypothetical protein